MDENSSAAVRYQFDPIRDSLFEPHFRNDYDKNEELSFWVRLIMSAAENVYANGEGMQMLLWSSFLSFRE